MIRHISVILSMLVLSIAASAQSTHAIKAKLTSISNSSQRLDSAYAMIERMVDSKDKLYIIEVGLKAAREAGDVPMESKMLRAKAMCIYNVDMYSSEEDCRIQEAILDTLMRLDLNTIDHRNNISDVTNLIFLDNVWMSKFATALEIANDHLDLSVSRHDNYGQITAYEMLGVGCQNLYQNEEAIAHFTKAYNISKNYPELYRSTINLLMEILDAYFTDDKFADCKWACDEATKVMDEVKAKGYVFPYMDMVQCETDLYYAFYYMDIKDYKTAYKYIKNAEKSNYLRVDNHTSLHFNVAYARYYCGIGKPSMALECLSNVEHNTYLIYLNQRIVAYRQLGEYEKAFALQDSVINLLSDTYSTLFESQLSEMQAKYDVAGLAEQASQSELLANQMRLNALVVAVIFILLFTIILLYLVMRLRKGKRVVENANRMQQSFLHNMSHEIRTPLNAICGLSQILTTPELRPLITPEEEKQYADIIKNNTDMLSTLVNDILEVADLESGKYRVNLSQHSANDICSKAISTVQLRCPSNVRMYYTSDVGDDFEICTDPQRTQQVIINFLTNACKHTDKGEIHLHCSNKEHPGNVTFSVTDTGEGVPPEMAEVIFGRFEKLSTFKQGTGLGLSICRMIATRLHGRVCLDTEYTAGARFLFIHPFSQD